MDEHDFVFWILMAMQLARTEPRQPLVMQGYWEFAMEFAMEHFQIKKPRDKARREFRRWRMSPAGHSRARAIERFREKARQERRELSTEKNAVQGRLCEFSSWTSVLDSLNSRFWDFVCRSETEIISPKFSGRLGLRKFECDDRTR